MNLDRLLEKDILPDALIRAGIRRLDAARLKEQHRGTVEDTRIRENALIDFLKESPIAVQTDAANEQHYEVPAEFYKLVLGRNMKYSSCYYDENTSNLGDAEDRMIEITCERADLHDGQKILELGCGWGSLTLAMAERYPKSMITAVSNSSSQKAYIEKLAKERKLKNIRIITADMNDFRIRETFDRVVSVEMFEHMRNYELLFQKVHGFLKKQGKLFIHIFTHRDTSYLFEPKDETDRMSRYFFSGGIMPSNYLFYAFTAPFFKLEKQWLIDGTHYHKTAEDWLSNMDANRDKIMKIFAETYPSDSTRKWWAYWRIFFMAVSELFRYNNGKEWMVSHYRFEKS